MGYWILGFIVALAIAFVVIVALIGFYSFLRKKYPHRKFLNEVIVVGIPFLASLIVRVIVVLVVNKPENDVDNIPNGIAYGFYLLYSAIGGFSFEGVDELGELVKNGLQALYYGVLVGAGLTALITITVGVSYEFSSRLKISVRNFNVKVLSRLGCKCRPVYVFTNTSEESILLAQDIQKQINEKKENATIVFMGNELEAFDRKNEAHRIIMNHGFYYCSYAKRRTKAEELSLLKMLGYRKRIIYRRKKRESDREVHIFALKDDAGLRGAEGKNSDFIFDDIKAVLRDYVKCKEQDLKEKIPAVIHYYISTHNVIDYEFYETYREITVKEFLRKRNLSWEKINEKGEKGKNLLQKMQFHVLNEAKLSSINLIQEFHEEIFLAKAVKDICCYKSCVAPNENGIYRVAVFGFGKTGQYSLTELFTQTASFIPHQEEESFYRASTFIADVYDQAADERSGEFAYAHPMILCKNSYDEHQPESIEKLQDWASKVKNGPIEVLCRDGVAKGLSEERVKGEMGFPIVTFHKISAFEKGFMKQDDSLSAIYDKTKVDYRAFLICMGNDEANIALANMLIDEMKHESLLHLVTPSIPKIVFVHIRDEKNRERVHWREEDCEEFADSFRVVLFGCREDIWSYEAVIDDKLDRCYQYAYDKVYHVIKEGKQSIREMMVNGKQPIKEMIAKVRKELRGSLIDEREFRNTWLDTLLYLKESNRSARDFGITFYLGHCEEYSDEYWSALEHLRWVRFYISNGWVYAQYEKSEKAFRRRNKEHTCLCPVAMLEDSDKPYDLVNVELGKIREISMPFLNRRCS